MVQLPALPEFPPGVEPFEITRALAAAAHPGIIKELAFRAQDGSMATSQLISISDHLAKVSGLLAKQEEKANTDRFVFNIHFGGANSSRGITIDCAASDDDDLGAVPEYLRGGSGNITSDLLAYANG